MRSFVTYLQALLTRPLRRGRDSSADIGRLIQLLGEAWDQAGQVLYAVRRAWFVRTCPEGALPLHGDERALWRLPDESAEAYRERLAAAWSTWQAGGTDPGLVAALALVGLPGASIRRHEGTMPWRVGARKRIGDGDLIGGENIWAFFDVVATLPADGVSEETMAQWLATIDRWKAAHARLWPEGGAVLDMAGDIEDTMPPPDDILEVQAVLSWADRWPVIGGGIRIGDLRPIGDNWVIGSTGDVLEITVEEVQ